MGRPQPCRVQGPPQPRSTDCEGVGLVWGQKSEHLTDEDGTLLPPVGVVASPWAPERCTQGAMPHTAAHTMGESLGFPPWCNG